MRNIVTALAVAGGLSALIIWASRRIAAKAGYNSALASFMIVSPLNLLLLLVFAGSEWPIERRLRNGCGSG